MIFAWNNLYASQLNTHMSLPGQFQDIRVKSGILGQTAKFRQPPCLFHSSIIELLE